MIYLASPYSGTREQMQTRFEQVLEYTIAGIKSGFVVFSPIVTWHPHAESQQLPTDAGFWWNYNRAMLDKADFAIMFLSEGHEESAGMRQEHAYCVNHDIPMLMLEPRSGSPEQAWGLIGTEYRHMLGRVKPLRRRPV